MLTYSWGFSGWLGSSNTNTITLTPASLINVPSSVTVTPFLNGVAQPQLVCTVSRKVFLTSNLITGNATLCSNSAVYTINNLLPGESIASWSVSNPSIAYISNNVGSSVTLTKTGSGTVSLFATIVNACSQNTTIQKTITVGSPVFPNNVNVTGPTSVGFNQTVYYELSGNATNGATSYFWSIDAPINDAGGPTCSWQIVSGQGTKYVKLITGCINSTAVIRVVAKSSCGTSSIKYLYVNVSNNSNPCPSSSLNIFQKAGSNSLAGSVVYNPCNNLTAISNFVKIYDFSGNIVHSGNQLSNSLNFNDVFLKKGIYFIHVTTKDGQVLKDKFVVK